MSNFSKKLENATEEELKGGLNEHTPIFANLESDELTRRTLNKLQETIKTFNEQSSKQTEKMVVMTEVITKLTFVMMILALIQFAISLWQVTFSVQQNGLSLVTGAYLLFLIIAIWFIFREADKLKIEYFPKKHQNSIKKC
jgi:hypothetical protein